MSEKLTAEGVVATMLDDLHLAIGGKITREAAAGLITALVAQETAGHQSSCLA